MSDVSRTDAEAAAWLVRLAAPVVAQEELSAFRTWRDLQANDEAFRRQQEIWRRAGRLPPDPELHAAVAAARGRQRRQAVTRGRVAWAVGAAAAIAGLVAVVALQPEAYATAVGERSQIRLADGSSVALDADSRITVSLGSRHRTVRLTRGQALFDVAHDSRRPFTVSAGDLSVLAVGTRFDVRRRDGAHAQVTLLQGRVQVQAGQGGRRISLALAPGQETSSTRPQARPAQLDDAVAWTSGRLVFRAEPLGDVVAETNRYSRRPLRLVSDARLDQVRVTGAFTAGDTEAVAQALADLYGLKVTSNPDGAVVLRPG